MENIGDLPGGEGGEERNHKPEDEAESLRYSRRESLSDELIGGAETPEELFIGLRQLEKQTEDSRIPPNLSERYTPPRQLSVMYERAEMMGYSLDFLQQKGWVVKDPKTGELKPKDRRFGAFAISTEQIERTDSRGRFMPPEVKYNFGTNESREQLAKAYNRAINELASRDILGEHVGLRLNRDVRDSLENLTAILHGGRMPTFKPVHLEALFNMPSVAELATNPENKQLGDMVEKAMFLNLIMLNSGTKQRMQDFLDRPGAKYLIARLAKDKDMSAEDWKKKTISERPKARYIIAIRDEDESIKEWKKKYIGEVEKWFDDDKRILEDESKDGNVAPATWRIEADNGTRGVLTEFSNISAWGGDKAEFSERKEIEFIEKTIGGLVGGGKEGVEASWVAASIMRAIGAYASEGYVALPSGESLLPLGEGRFISGDDTGKFWAYMFNMKEGLNGRKSGLKDMIGKIPDMAMNLFDWAGVETPDLPKYQGRPDGPFEKRSIWDAWLGTPVGKPKTDLLTGEKSTTEVTKEEPYHRLGDLEFRSLEPDFHGTFTTMQWLMGNKEGPTGVFIEAMKTNFQFEKDYNLENLKAIWKYISIVMNPIILTKGSSHLYTNPGKAKVIAKNFFRNLMSARIRSASFAMGILNSTTRLFNPGVKLSGVSQIEVPTALLAEMFIEEALKDNPKDEDELVKHYLDENSKLRKAGTQLGVAKVLDNATFEEKNIGRVTGRKVT